MQKYIGFATPHALAPYMIPGPQAIEVAGQEEGGSVKQLHAGVEGH